MMIESSIFEPFRNLKSILPRLFLANNHYNGAFHDKRTEILLYVPVAGTERFRPKARIIDVKRTTSARTAQFGAERLA